MNTFYVKDKELRGYIVSILIINPAITLNVGANIEYNLYSRQTMKSVWSSSVVLEGEGYDLWTNDDMYVVNLVLEKEGLELITN